MVDFTGLESQQRFQANLAMARQSMGHRFAALDWSVVQQRRDTCHHNETQNPWTIHGDNFLKLPQILPSSAKAVEIYEGLNEGLELGAGMHQYLDLHGKDPHLLKPVLKLRDAVKAQQFDPNFNVTTSHNFRPYFLVAFGTGDGRTLQALLNVFKPYHLVLALADWQDLATSFWSINWQEIAQQQNAMAGGKFTIGCYKNSISVLTALVSDCHAGVDHALLYLPPEGGCSDQASQLRAGIRPVDLDHSITYLGFTVDEFNMVWNSWQTLVKRPRVFRRPMSPLGGRMVVCGSGPSLDANLDDLRALSEEYLIVACGSNYRTLKANGIRVDLLALVERADVVFHDIQKVVEQYGAGQTRLAMSTTCHHQLLDLFADGMVYFRPALTPLAIFSNSMAEVLGCEGPESINTGVALASAMGMDELVLVGVDLGARSLEKVRSAAAAGRSPRDLNLEAPGNFGGTVLTSRLLRDTRMSVETCLRGAKNLTVYNCSDGVAIEGAKPCRLNDRVAAMYTQSQQLNSASFAFNQWWTASERYTPERFIASWKSRRPRAETASLLQSLRDLFASSEPWNPVVIQKITLLLKLDVRFAAQFPRRILRSTIHKLVVAVNRQLMVMAQEPEKRHAFECQARSIFLEHLDLYEAEIYALCDALESMPQSVESSVQCDSRKGGG